MLLVEWLLEWFGIRLRMTSLHVCSLVVVVLLSSRLWASDLLNIPLHLGSAFHMVFFGAFPFIGNALIVTEKSTATVEVS